MNNEENSHRTDGVTMYYMYFSTFNIYTKHSFYSGKDTNVTIMLLAARTKEQRCEIREEYEKKYNVVCELLLSPQIPFWNL